MSKQRSGLVGLLAGALRRTPRDIRVLGQRVAVANRERARLERQLARVQQRQETLATEHKAVRVYGALPELSLDAFRMRTPEGWPRLAVFSYDKPEGFIIGAACVARKDAGACELLEWIRPEVPQVLYETFEDVHGKLFGGLDFRPDGDYIQRDGWCGFAQVFDKLSVFLATSFDAQTMTVPNKIKAAVASVRERFERIYIVAEPQRWEIAGETILRPEVKDPLIVGWGGGRFWLIAKYTETMFEHYITSEFCSASAPKKANA